MLDLVENVPEVFVGVAGSEFHGPRGTGKATLRGGGGGGREDGDITFACCSH